MHQRRTNQTFGNDLSWRGIKKSSIKKVMILILLAAKWNQHVEK